MEVTCQILGRRVEIIDVVEETVIGEDVGEPFFNESEVDPDACFIQFVDFHLNLDLESMTMDFFTFSLVFFQEMGCLKLIFDL